MRFRRNSGTQNQRRCRRSFTRSEPKWSVTRWPVATDLNPQVVAWRRDFHQNPELGTRERRTARVIADELTKLGFIVTTGVATTGVVGVLKGGLPGPVVALDPRWMPCR
jgi:hypothetical protein